MNKEQGISHMERVRLKSTTTKISKKQEAHTSAPQNTPVLTLAQHILHLQWTVGNRAVGRLMQAKLAVSHPEDPYFLQPKPDSSADDKAKAKAEQAAKVKRYKDLLAQNIDASGGGPFTDWDDYQKKAIKSGTFL